MKWMRFFDALLTAAIASLALPAVPLSRTQPTPPSIVSQSPLIASPAVTTPFVTYVTHNLGKVALTVSNNGVFGANYVDVTGDVPSCEYPIGSGIEYLYGGSFWIGAIVGRDTLVSVGTDGWNNPLVKEFWPPTEAAQDVFDEGVYTRGIGNPDDPNFADAKSELDVIAVYYDTLTGSPVIPDNWDARPHRPLNIRVKETSYSWSYEYAEDFVLFDYQITNIDNFRTLEKVYMGIYVDADVGFSGNADKYLDDICGFKRDVDGLNFTGTSCTFKDTINIAWIADNNGVDSPTDAPENFDPNGKRGDPLAVAGTRVVRTPNKDSLDISFNWWVSNGTAALDFGPRRKGTPEDPFRDFGGFLGTPEGDRTKYYVMSHGEFDYDQLKSALNLSDSGWLPPGPQAADVANGFDTRYFLSFGPFTIFPGETLPITFAHVLGDNFHRKPLKKMADGFNPADPQAYIDRLNFSDLGVNAQWASWLYDNPGVDSDGDGFKGKFRICYEVDSIAYDTFWSADSTEIDSIIARTIHLDSTLVYYEGDGVPDFRGASPPPSPILRLSAQPNKLELIFNGVNSEKSPDEFSSALDFEGYRVYAGHYRRTADLVLKASYDREDFKVYFFDVNIQPFGQWRLVPSAPASKREIQLRYANGNTNFDPLANNVDQPLRVRDSSFYFVAQDYNQDDLADTTLIHRVYPNAPDPHQTDSLNLAFPWGTDTFWVNPEGDTTRFPNGELTPDGKYFQRYEYRYVLSNLQASQLQYVSVTAFDYGAPAQGLGALESSPLSNIVGEYAQWSSDSIAAKDLEVVVYPNPYRIDERYRDQGFEGRGLEDRPDDAVRALHFTNLPPACVIRIYTLDGDLVREIQHDRIPNSPASAHDQWDLVTRNRQLAVSGMYYWVVEEPAGKTQIGKFVLIL